MSWDYNTYSLWDSQRMRVIIAAIELLTIRTNYLRNMLNSFGMCARPKELSMAYNTLDNQAKMAIYIRLWM